LQCLSAKRSSHVEAEGEAERGESTNVPLDQDLLSGHRRLRLLDLLPPHGGKVVQLALEEGVVLVGEIALAVRAPELLLLVVKGSSSSSPRRGQVGADGQGAAQKADARAKRREVLVPHGLPLLQEGEQSLVARHGRFDWNRPPSQVRAAILREEGDNHTITDW